MSHQNEKRSQAHNPWNQVFQTQGRVFEEPHPLLPTVVERLKANQAQNVLDLGAGTGRHVIFLASNGFTTYALDSAPEGLAQTQRWLSSVGLQATLLEHDIYQPLPFADQFFDSIVSIQVIHHARLHQIEALVAELHRILKPGGLLLVTVAKAMNQAHHYQELEPNTYLPLDGREAGLPHYFFTPEQLRQSFHQFTIEEIGVDEVEHTYLIARRDA